MAPNTRESESARVRAAKACERCNRKRVKCDVTETGQPCSRCRKNGTVECNLTVSRRGRYSRDAIKLRAATARQEVHENGNGVSDVNGHSEALQYGLNIVSNLHSVQSHEDERNPRSVPGHHEGPGDDDTTPDSITSPGHHPSYREISWSGVFNHFLDSRQKSSRGVIDKCSITYLGESFPLALVLEDLHDGGSLRLHHPGPPLEENEGIAAATPERAHPSHLLPEDMNCLLSKKAFEYPERATYDALISTFLDTYYPMYPIVNRHEFIHQYENDTLPWILLQACCFVGATFCHESVLHRAGYTGRRQARFSFYRKAKALFDTGYESNKIVILQTVMMLSHWGGAPNTYWNFYSWLSNGVTIAETLGIHRSLRHTNMMPKDASLLKRLWWILSVRDAFTAVLVGRPFRINTDMGDAEMLTIEDFEYDDSRAHTSAHHLGETYGLYHIEQAKLSLLLRQIVYTRWLPGRMKHPSNVLHESLRAWKQALHPALCWEMTPVPENIYALILSILYNHHVILADLGAPKCEYNAAQPTLESAAQQISTTASSLVVRSQSLQVPHETFQGIFLAGVASYTQLRSPQATVAQLGRSTLNNCQMVLQNVYNSWDASSWVMDLFEKLSNGLEKLANGLPKTVAATDPERNDATDASAMEWIDFDASTTIDFGIGSPWQSNPMLSALFDFPTEFGDLGHAMPTHPETGSIPT